MLRRKKLQQNGRRQPSTQPTNNAVFSYRANRSRESDTIRQYDNANDAQPRRFDYRQWLRNLPSLIALTAVFMSFLYCLGLTTNPQVILSSPNTDTVALRDKKAYQTGAETILKQSILNRSKLTISTSDFSKAFTTRYPEVSDVTLTLPLISRRPVISIDTAQPTLILTVQRNIMVLDTRGKVIMMAEDLASTTRQTLPVVNDETGVTAELGRTVLPPEDVQYITSVVTQLKAKNIPIESITLPPLAREMHVRLQGQPYFVKFNFSTDSRVAAGTFLATKQKLEKDRTVPSEYIDVRLEERAYYK